MTKQPLHILIDGADGLGKTTVIQKLSMNLQLPIIKMPNMKEYVEKGLAEEFSKLFNQTIVQFSQFDFILDRGFTSSIVYSKVFERDSDLSYLTSIRNILKPHVFILTGEIPPEDNNFRDGNFDYFRTDELFNYDEVSKVDAEFVRLAKDQGYPLIRVWGHSPDEIVSHIINVINKHE